MSTRRRTALASATTTKPTVGPPDDADTGQTTDDHSPALDDALEPRDNGPDNRSSSLLSANMCPLTTTLDTERCEEEAAWIET